MEVLANWQPSALHAPTIRLEFVALLRKLGVSLTTTLSPGVWTCERLTPETFVWHQDCNGIRWNIILWSNKQPTEVRECGTHKQLSFNAGDVLHFNNLDYEHRTPKNVDETRWVVRVRSR